VDALKEACDFLREGDRFLLATHRNADGDGLASLLACGMLLRRMGKSYLMVVSGGEVLLPAGLAGGPLLPRSPALAPREGRGVGHPEPRKARRCD